MRRRHEVEQRRVAEVVLHHARRDDVEPLAQPGLLGVASPRSASATVGDLAGVLRRAASGSPALSAVGLLASRGSARSSRFAPRRRRSALLRRRSTVRRRATPRSRSGPGRRSPSRTGSRASRGTAGCRRPSSFACSSSTFCLVRRDVLLRPPAAAPASCCSLFLSTRARRLLELRLRHLVLELREPPLRVLPVAVEVVPDHPDDRQEQEQAGRREDDVQEVDVVGVPDALLFSHGLDVEEEFRNRHDVLQVEDPAREHLDRQRHHHQEQEHVDVVARRAQLLVVAP